MLLSMRFRSWALTRHRAGDDCSDLLRCFASVERVSEPGQLVRVEEPRDVVARVLRDAEAGVGATLAQSPLLGPEHHRAQYLQGAVGCAGLFPVRRVEPRGHILRTDAFERHPAERGQDAGVQVDAHSLAPPRASSAVRSAADTRPRTLATSGASSRAGCRRRGYRPRGCARACHRRGGGPPPAPSRHAGRWRYGGSVPSIGCPARAPVGPDDAGGEGARRGRPSGAGDRPESGRNGTLTINSKRV